MKFFIEYTGPVYPRLKWFEYLDRFGGPVCCAEIDDAHAFASEQEAWNYIDNTENVGREHFKVTPLESK